MNLRGNRQSNYLYSRVNNHINWLNYPSNITFWECHLIICLNRHNWLVLKHGCCVQHCIQWEAKTLHSDSDIRDTTWSWKYYINDYAHQDVNDPDPFHICRSLAHRHCNLVELNYVMYSECRQLIFCFLVSDHLMGSQADMLYVWAQRAWISNLMATNEATSSPIFLCKRRS